MNKAPPRLSAAALAVPSQLRIGENARVRRVAAMDAAGCVGALADLLIDCVEGGASVGLMLPLPRDKAVAFWTTVAIGVARGKRVLLVAENPFGHLVGVVQVIADPAENRPHCANVATLLVHPGARRHGIGLRLMAALDKAAHAERKEVLVFDVVTGSDAARLCQCTGWKRAGDIPGYGMMPGGRFCSSTLFYKHL